MNSNMIIVGNDMGPMGDTNQNLVACLKDTLANAFVMSLKAHGHHWNVTGEDFHEFHDFFGGIYEDVDGSVDPLAENIRKRDAMTPFFLSDFAALTSIEDIEVGGNAMAMCKDLLMANDVMIQSLNECFESATMANDQGIANFIGGRLEMHAKWRWQLRSTLGIS
jgi:starvation-inducible DNA-binding protein